MCLLVCGRWKEIEMEKRERSDFDSDAEGTWQQTEPALLHEKWSRWS